MGKAVAAGLVTANPLPSSNVTRANLETYIEQDGADGLDTRDRPGSIVQPVPPPVA